jgi:hypothetical protein
MHRLARQGKPATAIDPIISRTLRREYRIFAPDAQSRHYLRFLQADPDIADIELERIDIVVERSRGFLSARLPDGSFAEGTANHILEGLHRLIYWDLEQSHPGSPLIHGASVLVNGRRFVLTADKGSGKTTLSLFLLAAGFMVEGDEHVVLVPQGGVVARPRSLRVKPGSLRMVPDLPGISMLPMLSNWDGTRIFAVSPRIFGRPWTIRQGPVDGIIFIEANHGGRSVLKPMTPDAVFTSLMQTVYFPRVSPLTETAMLRRLVATAPAWSLRLGDLTGAKFHLERAVAP